MGLPRRDTWLQGHGMGRPRGGPSPRRRARTCREGVRPDRQLESAVVVLQRPAEAICHSKQDPNAARGGKGGCQGRVGPRARRRQRVLAPPHAGHEQGPPPGAPATAGLSLPMPGPAASPVTHSTESAQRKLAKTIMLEWATPSCVSSRCV